MPSVEELAKRRCAKELLRIIEQIPARIAARTPILLDEYSLWAVALWTMLRWERTFLMIGLEDMGVDVWTLTREVDELLDGRRAVGRRLAWMNVAPSVVHRSPAAIGLGINRLLDQVQVEARAMGHKYLGVEHLLLAIISGADPSLYSILSRHGVTREKVTKMLRQLLPNNLPSFEETPAGNYRHDKPFHNKPRRGFPSFTSWDTEAVGAPRRFGIGVMLLMMTMYAVLFAFMQVMGTPPVVFAFIAIFVTGVGFAQMALFGGKYPRAASIWAGAFLLPIQVGALIIWNMLYLDAEPVIMTIAITIAVAVPCIPLGVFLGYLSGGLTAGVFLLIEKYWKKEEPIEAEEVPEHAVENDHNHDPAQDTTGS